jgi:hypothetical protein
MLEIIKEIKRDGLDFVVNKYKLIYKDYGHKFLLKYNQIDSYPFKGVDAVRECRGLILSNNLEVLSYPFKRFFNVQENEADPIDFSKADVLKKEDGSLTALYWDEYINQWCVQTSGTADAKTQVGSHNKTFEDLFWEIFYGTYMVSTDDLDKNKNYVFEMCSKWNQVVAFHQEPKLVLLNVRDLTDLSEVSYPELIEIGKSIGIPAVESYNLNSIEGIHEMIKDMASEEEGFVAFDGTHRVKIKNPKYVLRHKSETEFTQKDIFTILKENEKDEFLGLIDRYTELYHEAEHFWLKLVVAGYKFRDVVNDYVAKLDTKKDFALAIKVHMTEMVGFFLPYAYRMMDDKLSTGIVTPFDPEVVLREVDNKKLNEMFNKNKRNG